MTSTNQAKYTDGVKIRNIFLRPFQRRFVNAVAALEPTSLLELGTGEGYLLNEIHQRLPQARLVGLDLIPEFVAEGKRVFPHLDLRTGDIYHINEPDQSWDVVVASEVLEHLDRPADALRELTRVAKHAVVLSVPWEPFFRLGNFARGKHWQRFGNHPEHINLWTGKKFVAFASEQLIVDHVIPSLPWTIVVGRPRR